MNTQPNYLDYPDADAIRQTFRAMPRGGVLLLSCRVGELTRTLLALERTGFHGMLVEAESPAAEDVDITARKGKQGPCLETGRTAYYRGAALAALDDDNHLIRKSIRVCEKTASLYSGEPYNGLIEVSDPDPELFARRQTDPVSFDCNTLEADAAQLRRDIAEPAAREPASTCCCGGGSADADAPARSPLFYGGPFRALVLADGTILRRGQTTPVPAESAEALLREGCLPPAPRALITEPEFFSARYDREGATCLLDDLPLAEACEADRPLRMEALADVGPAFRDRLLGLIQRGDRQLVITGSDPRNPFGCCPSPEVLEANLLAEAGVLSRYHAPVPPDACPTTLYAFRDEITPENGRPTVTVNPDFRSAVADYFQEKVLH